MKQDEKLVQDIQKISYKIAQARKWVFAIIYKGQQLFDMIEKSYKERVPDTAPAFEFMKRSEKNDEILKIEETFFLDSVVKAKKWLEKIEKLDSSNDKIKDALNVFEKATTARNVRQHDEEYIEREYSKIAKGRIKNQGESVLGMKWTFIVKDKYYCLGNVNVSEIISEAQKILPYLEDEKLVEKIFLINKFP